jgi:copper oxidase (laccase) domain-containing protein
MNAESIGAPAPCANKNDIAAVFGPSTRRAAMTIDHRTIRQFRATRIILYRALGDVGRKERRPGYAGGAPSINQ